MQELLNQLEAVKNQKKELNQEQMREWQKVDKISDENQEIQFKIEELQKLRDQHNQLKAETEKISFGITQEKNLQKKKVEDSNNPVYME